MKTKIRILSVLAILVLSSCSGSLPDISLPDFNFPSFARSAEPEGFYGHLANEYKNLASYEEEYMKHEDDAAHFAAKARRALRHQNVKPDRTVDRNIPDFSIEELQTAHSILTDALENLQIEENEALLAMAQTRYDCWLAHQEDFPEEDAWIACKIAFYDALSLLEIAPEDRIAHTVYFDSGSTSLTEEGRQAIQKVAERYADRKHWDIVLKGFTDSKGDKTANKILSMRRAIAVKNTLGQFGVDLNNVAISAEGETAADEEDERNSRRVEMRAWPHYAAKNKKGISVLSGWNHAAGS